MSEKKTWIKCPGGCGKFLLPEWDNCKNCGWQKNATTVVKVTVGCKHEIPFCPHCGAKLV